jgi:hypothetical protein
MKVIKSKTSKTPAKIDSLMRPPPSAEQGAVNRLLVVYGEQDASIYYEASEAPKRAES